jgi:hypothetical protein
MPLGPYETTGASAIHFATASHVSSTMSFTPYVTTSPKCGTWVAFTPYTMNTPPVIRRVRGVNSFAGRQI